MSERNAGKGAKNRVFLYSENNQWYAATATFVTNEKGQEEKVMTFWGAVTKDREFIPGENYLNATPEEKAELLFPDDWFVSQTRPNDTPALTPDKMKKEKEEAQSEETPKPKKTRGRPRKNPLPEQAEEAASAEEPPAEPRKRGRPRKKKPDAPQEPVQEQAQEQVQEQSMEQPQEPTLEDVMPAPEPEVMSEEQAEETVPVEEPVEEIADGAASAEEPVEEIADGAASAEEPVEEIADGVASAEEPVVAEVQEETAIEALPPEAPEEEAPEEEPQEEAMAEEIPEEENSPQEPLEEAMAEEIPEEENSPQEPLEETMAEEIPEEEASLEEPSAEEPEEEPIEEEPSEEGTVAEAPVQEKAPAEAPKAAEPAEEKTSSQEDTAPASAQEDPAPATAPAPATGSSQRERNARRRQKQKARKEAQAQAMAEEKAKAEEQAKAQAEEQAKEEKPAKKDEPVKKEEPVKTEKPARKEEPAKKEESAKEEPKPAPAPEQPPQEAEAGEPAGKEAAPKEASVPSGSVIQLMGSPVILNPLDSSAQANNRLYGDLWLLEQVARKTGVWDDLRKAFSNDDTLVASLMTLAMYSCLTSGSPERVASWQTVVKAPQEMLLSPSAIKRTLQQVTDAYRKAFIELRIASTEKNLVIAHQVMKEKARRTHSLPWDEPPKTASYLGESIVYSMDDLIPVGFRLILTDKPASRSTELFAADYADITEDNLLLVTAEGEHRPELIGEYAKAGRRFLTSVSCALPPVMEILKSLSYAEGLPTGMRFDKERALCYGRYQMPAFSVKLAEGGRVTVDDAFVFLFFNIDARVRQIQELKETVEAEKELIAEQAGKKISYEVLEELENTLEYHKITTKGGIVNFTEKEKKIAKKKAMAGYFAMATREPRLDSMKALSIYRLLSSQEAYLEQDCHVGAPQIIDAHGKELMSAWPFVRFLGFILTQELDHVFASSDLCRSFSSPQEVLDEMRSIRYVQYQNGEAHVTALNARQQSICSALGIQPPKGRNRSFEGGGGGRRRGGYRGPRNGQKGQPNPPQA